MLNFRDIILLSFIVGSSTACSSTASNSNKNTSSIDHDNDQGPNAAKAFRPVFVEQMTLGAYRNKAAERRAISRLHQGPNAANAITSSSKARNQNRTLSSITNEEEEKAIDQIIMWDPEYAELRAKYEKYAVRKEGSIHEERQVILELQLVKKELRRVSRAIRNCVQKSNRRFPIPKDQGIPSNNVNNEPSNPNGRKPKNTRGTKLGR